MSRFSIFVSTASIGSLACLVYIPRPGPCSVHQWSPSGAKAALYCLNIARNTARTGLFARADDPRAHACYTHNHTFIPIAHSCHTYIHNQTTGVTCRMQARLKLGLSKSQKRNSVQLVSHTLSSYTHVGHDGRKSSIKDFMNLLNQLDQLLYH